MNNEKSLAGAQVVTKYYLAGGKVVALRQGGVLSYLFSDHLPLQGASRGSTTVTTDSSGTKTAEMRYKPCPQGVLRDPQGVLREGETRYTSGTTPTAKHYTGQYEESGIGLYFYNARWYDPLLGRFAQADSIIPEPGNPLGWDRYAYVQNGPVNFKDPSGHTQVCADGDLGGGCGSTPTEEQVYHAFSYDPNHPESPGSLFAEYYALSFLYNQQFDKGNLKAEATLGAAEIAYLRAISYVPQKDISSVMLMSTSSIAESAQLIVGIGKEGVEYLSGAIIGSLRIPNPRGMNGNSDHQIGVGQARILATQKFGPNVIIQESKSIKRILGIDRRPDISVWDSSGKLLQVYEVARVDKSGNFVPREMRKMAEYYKMGIPFFFVKLP